MSMKNRCLVVDDDEMVRRLVSLSLKRAGFEVVAEAASSEDARSAATSVRPDIVLVDLMLAGVDRNAPIADLRALLPEAVIVVLSGMAVDEHGPPSQLAGADHYLGKSALVDIGPVLARLLQ